MYAAANVSVELTRFGGKRLLDVLLSCVQQFQVYNDSAEFNRLDDRISRGGKGVHAGESEAC